MRKATLFNIGGAVVAIGAAVFLLQDHLPFSGRNFQSAAHDAYTSCLAAGYEKGGARAWRLLLKSYHGCKAEETAYKNDLRRRHVLPEKKIMRHIEQLNEAAIARFLGVSPDATKGWGCLRPKKPKELLVS